MQTRWPDSTRLSHFAVLAVLALFVHSVSGCATVRTRVGSERGEVDPIFPATKSAKVWRHELLKSEESPDWGPGGIYYGIVFIGDFGTAIITDLVLLPFDLMMHHRSEENRSTE